MQSLIILTWPYPILVIGDKNYLMEKKNKKITSWQEWLWKRLKWISLYGLNVLPSGLGIRDWAGDNWRGWEAGLGTSSGAGVSSTADVDSFSRPVTCNKENLNNIKLENKTKAIVEINL